MSVVRPLKTLSLRESCGDRTSGYTDECLKLGKIAGVGDDATIEFTDAQFESLRKKYNPRYKQSEHALPPTGEMLINFTSAVGRLAKALLSGEEIIRPEERQQEIKTICRACEFYRVSDGRCGKCGCDLENYVAKTKLATEHCPLNPQKW
jgi:hypothetical protein